MIHLVEHGIHHAHAVGAFLLGNSDGNRLRPVDGLTLVGRARVMGHQVFGFFRAFGYGCHITQVNRQALVIAHHQPFEVGCRLHEGTGFYPEILARAFHRAHSLLGIELLNGLGNVSHADAIAFQPLGLYVYAHLLGAAAANECVGCFGQRFQILHQAHRQGAQPRIVHFL